MSTRAALSSHHAPKAKVFRAEAFKDLLLDDRRALLIVVVLSVLLWLPRMRGPVDLRWDGGAYYILGTALAQSKGYRLLNEPGEIEATQYPPLLPLVIAA